MSLGRAHLVATLATLTLAVLGVVSGSALLLGTGLALVALLVAGAPSLLAPRRSRIRTVLVHLGTVLVLLLAMAAFRRITIDAAVVVVMAGIGNRYLLRANHRDDLILCGAATVLMTLATTITPGLEFLLLFLAFVPAAHSMLHAAQLVALTEPLPAVEREAQSAHWQRQPAPKKLGTLIALGWSLSVLGYGAMALFPRYHFVQWLGAGALMSLAGAGGSMDLRTDGVRGGPSGPVVLRVTPGPGVDRGSLEGLYARLYALDRFDGRSFGASPGLAPCPNCGRTRPEKARNQVVRVALARQLPGSVRHPVALLGRERPVRPAIFLQEEVSGTVVSNLRSGLQELNYEAELGGSALELLPPTPALVALPEELDPRVRALAAKLTQGESSPGEKIAAVLRHFDGSFRYSLEPLSGESADPLVRFLFEAKEGHCELYAAAVAVLLRASGVPARVATGFYAGHWNPAGGFLELSGASAHAWVEAYDPARGWIWVDATPEDLRRSRPGRFAFVAQLIEAMEALWYEGVVDFDEARRRQLLGRLSGAVGDLAADVGGFDLGGDGGGASQGAGGGLGPGLLLLLGLGLGGGGIWRQVRRRRTPEVLGQHLRQALAVDADPTATLGQLLAALPPHEREPAARAVRLYEALRYGPGPEAPPIAAVREAIAALKASARRSRGSASPPSTPAA